MIFFLRYEVIYFTSKILYILILLRHDFFFLQVPLEKGIEKTVEYFRKELMRSKHSERNLHYPNIESNVINPPRAEDYTDI